MVAALHGPVYGAGVGLALACHLRLAAESAKFSVAFIKIGLILDTGVPFSCCASWAWEGRWR